MTQALRAPDDAPAFFAAGNALNEQLRYAEAVERFDRAVALDPRHAAAWCNRGLALRALDRYDEALASQERAAALVPRHPLIQYNLGVALRDACRTDDAARAFEEAIRLAPDLAEAHLNLAHCLLMDGDYERGFREFEWRWKERLQASRLRAFAQPLWLGREPVGGRTILLHAEGGFGDTLQMSRYAPMLAQRGAKVVLEAPRPLASLLSRVPGIARVVPSGDPLPDFDAHCPLMSLPLAMGTTLASVPREVPYLHPDPARVAAWRSRLGEATRPRVAIAWSGQALQPIEKHRRIPLAALAPLLVGGIEWIGVQKDVRDDDAAALAACRAVRHVGPDLEDFDDTAAVLDQSDLVVTVDTSVAHLAGAMGKPTWVLVSRQSEWRWQQGRSDNAWYPTARIVRQGTQGDWTGALAELSRALHGRFDLEGGR